MPDAPYATAERSDFGRRLVEVLLLVVMPVALPLAWGFGVLLLTSRQPKGWQTTGAISPLGLFAPLWFYARGISHQSSPWVAWPLAAALLTGCLATTWRRLRVYSAALSCMSLSG